MKQNIKSALEYAYNNYKLAEYPHFNQWKEKYTFYTLQKRFKGLIKIGKEEEKHINEELRTIVLYTNSTDAFTGLKAIETIQKRFIVMEN